MKEFQDKKKRRRFLYSLPTVVALIIVVLLFSRGVVNIYIKYRESLALKNRAQNELLLLQNRKDTLSHEIEKLSTDIGREGAIRNKFNVAKEGERVLLLAAPPEAEVATTTPNFFDTVLEKLKSLF